MSFLGLLRKKAKVKPPGRKGGAAETAAGPEYPGLGIVGHAGAGKTVFLAMLHEVCKEAGDLTFRSHDDLTAAEILQHVEELRGTQRRFLAAPQADTPRESRWPAPTATVRPLAFEAGLEGQPNLRISTLDYPGAGVSIYEDASRRKQVIEWLEKCDSLVFMIDPVTLASEADAQAQISAFRSILARASGPRGKRRVSTALIISKADQIEGFRPDIQPSLIPPSMNRVRSMDTHGMIEALLTRPEFGENPRWLESTREILNRLREILPVLREHDPDFQVFFVSSTGSPAAAGVPARPPEVLSPVGVREPMRWAVGRIGSRIAVERRKGRTRRIAIACGLIAAVVSVWNGSIWWHSQKTEPRRGDAIPTRVNRFERFDRSVLLWPRFLMPKLGAASRDRMTYAMAVHFHDQGLNYVRAGQADEMREMLTRIDQLGRRNSRAQSDMERLKRVLTRKWDDNQVRLVEKLIADRVSRETLTEEIGKIIDPVRRRAAEEMSRGLGSPLYARIFELLSNLGVNTVLIPGPLQEISAACAEFLADPASMDDPNRAEATTLKARADAALAALTITDPVALSDEIAALRSRTAQEFPALSAYLGLPRPGRGTAGGAGSAPDLPFREWEAKSRERDPRYNLVQLPESLRERVRRRLGSSDDLRKAAKYLEAIDQWKDPGVTLRLVITRQPRQGFHFHIGDDRGRPLATEYDQDHPGEFRWKLGQPFTMFLSSNLECTDEIRTISSWEQTGTLSVFDAAAAGSSGDVIFQTPDGPFRIEFEIQRLAQSIPVLE